MFGQPSPDTKSGFFIRPVAPRAPADPVTKDHVDRFLRVGGREALIALFRRAAVDCAGREWPAELSAVRPAPTSSASRITATALVGDKIACTYAYGTERYDLAILTRRHLDYISPAALAAALAAALDGEGDDAFDASGILDDPVTVFAQRADTIRAQFETVEGLCAAFRTARTFRIACEQTLDGARAAEARLRAQIQEQAGTLDVDLLARLGTAFTP